MLSFDSGDQTVRWTSGNEIAVRWLGDASISGPLQKLGRRPEGRVKAGAIVLLTATDDATAWQQAYEISQRGAALVLIPESPSLASAWSDARRRLPNLPPRIKALPQETGIQEMSMAVVRSAAFATLAGLADGTQLRLEAKLNPVQPGETWNTVGMIAGQRSQPARPSGALLRPHRPLGNEDDQPRQGDLPRRRR